MKENLGKGEDIGQDWIKHFIRILRGAKELEKREDEKES